MSEFIYSRRLTQNQKANGFSNSVEEGISGFLYVGGLDAIFVNLVATGSSVDFKFQIESKDWFGNVIQLHTGEFASADNIIVPIYPNTYEFLRTNVTNYSNGALFSSIAAKNFSTI